MQVSYRRAIACIKELSEKNLIWEQRQGRGLPNRIYLAKVKFSEKAAFSYDCAPFSADESRPAEMAGLENEPDTEESEEISEGIEENDVQMSENDTEESKSSEQDLPKSQFKTCRNRSSRPAKMALLEVPNLQV